MKPLKALLLSDGRPGHYHLAEGVLAAIKRRRPVKIQRIDIRRRPLAPARSLAAALKSSLSPGLVLNIGYGLRAASLPPADLVVSAGGQTIAANVACARILGAANIFCGSLRHVAPDTMSLTISSYAAHAQLPRHIVTLKPSGIDPDDLPPCADTAIALTPDMSSAPKIAGCLIGGQSGQFTYDKTDWDHLVEFLHAAQDTSGTGWIVSTSRRTEDDIADRLAALAAQSDGPIVEFIDFRCAGPGTLPSLFARAEAILCTADSSTMISEAVCARRPVIGVTPRHHSFTSAEAQYRQFMEDNNWTRTRALSELTPQSWRQDLKQIAPLEQNHLELLAARLETHLPGLFAD